jgi:hypothetical protein
MGADVVRLSLRLAAARRRAFTPPPTPHPLPRRFLRSAAAPRGLPAMNREPRFPLPSV